MSAAIVSCDHCGRRRHINVSRADAGPLCPACRSIAGPDVSRVDLAWKTEGECGQTDPEVFFSVHVAEQRAAQKVCGVCPVQQQCLSYALRVGEEYGVWGGLTPTQRARVASRLVLAA